MIGLLRAIPLSAWLVAVATGVAGWQYWQADRANARAERAESSALRAEGRADALGNAVSWQRKQLESLSSALAERDQQLADDEEAINQRRDTARQLERDDEATAQWADQPVPAATRQWLRALGTGAIGTHGDDAGRTELPAQAAAGPEPSGEPQP